jgi:hypothetical protein
VPDNLGDKFDDCDLDVTLAEDYANKLDPNSSDKSITLSHRVQAISSFVLKGDEEGSIDTLSGCVTDLRSVLGARFTAATLSRLANIANTIRNDLAAINTQAADAKAARDLAFVKQTVHTLVDEANFFSIDPVIIMDLARIGPQFLGAGGFRYGLGGGVRFTLLDTVRFTAGYAFNPNPRPWEGRGAAFFSMDILSLFR